jgi:hypothetical protein
LVDFWKAEYCDLEDGADLHFFVLMERMEFQVFQGLGEVLGGYFSFILSYFVSLDDGFCVAIVA